MKKAKYSPLLALGMGLVLAGTAAAVPTSLTVRVRAHDAKFVGTGVGDVQVTVRDFTSKDVLASGMITGGTGNTEVLMKLPKERESHLSDSHSASYTAQLDIDTPKKLLVEVDGPLSAGINSHHDSKTAWLIPGQNIDGDGLIFEMYGLIVRNYHPTQHEFVALGSTATIGTHVTPMCGCPVSTSSLWDAKNYSVTTTVMKNGQRIDELPMQYVGRISDFEAQYTFKEGGTYMMITTAKDDKNNTGTDITSYVVVPEGAIQSMSGKSQTK